MIIANFKPDKVSSVGIVRHFVIKRDVFLRDA